MPMPFNFGGQMRNMFGGGRPGDPNDIFGRNGPYGAPQGGVGLPGQPFGGPMTGYPGAGGGGGVSVGVPPGGMDGAGLMDWIRQNPDALAQMLSGAGMVYGGIQDRKLQRDILGEERRQYDTDNERADYGMGHARRAMNSYRS